MVSNQKILNEIEQLEAIADSMKERCYKLRKTLGVVSTTPTGLNGKRAELIAKGLASRNKSIQKKRA